MAYLSGFSAAPLLYFSNRQSIPHEKYSFYLGIQYRSGKSLVEIKPELNLDQLKRLSQSILVCIQSLHEGWGIAHGDISPKNILVQRRKLQNQEEFLITLVDWEFAERIRGQKLSSYSEYKGTQGYSAFSDQFDYVSKDWLAYDACVKYLGVKQDTSPRGRERRTIRKWLPWI